MESGPTMELDGFGLRGRRCAARVRVEVDRHRVHIAGRDRRKQLDRGKRRAGAGLGVPAGRRAGDLDHGVPVENSVCGVASGRVPDKFHSYSPEESTHLAGTAPGPGVVWRDVNRRAQVYVRARTVANGSALD